MLPFAAAVYLVMSLITFTLFALDKKSAVAGRRRIPEVTLHMVEFLGGWPGALLAMRLLRHKSAKVRYRLITAAIALLHIAVGIAVLA